jgi:hypothetical protein
MENSMKKALLILAIGLVVLIVNSCTKIENPKEEVLPIPKSDDAGVIVVGYNSNGYVLNNSKSPLRIECVFVHDDTGLVTQWIKVLQPQEKVLMYVFGSSYDWYTHLFYVYDLNGAKIGFVRPQKEAPLKGAENEK